MQGSVSDSKSAPNTVMKCHKALFGNMPLHSEVLCKAHLMQLIPDILCPISNYLKTVGVMACTRFLLQGRYKLHKKENKSCLSCSWHAYWSSSSALPNIKLSQTVWKLWPAQFFSFRGDNYIKKVCCLSCMRHNCWSASSSRSNIKLSQTIWDFFLNIIKLCLRVSKL